MYVDPGCLLSPMISLMAYILRENDSVSTVFSDTYLMGMFGRMKAAADPAMLPPLRESIEAIKVVKNHGVRLPYIPPFEHLAESNTNT